MPNSLMTTLDTLKKILSLEKDKGYSNNSVVGGIDKFLESSNRIRRLVQLPASGYENMTEKDRASWLKRALHTLDNLENPVPKNREPSRNRTASKTLPNKTNPAGLPSPISAIPRITKTQIAKLNHIGVNTIHDLIYLFPNRHNDFGQLTKVSTMDTNTDHTLLVEVWESRAVLIGGRHKSTEAIVGDETGNIRVVWFNQPYLANTFKSGMRLVLSGKANRFRDRIVLESPEYEILKKDEQIDASKGMFPIYPLTNGISLRTVRRLVKTALTTWLKSIEDPLPESLRRKYKLMNLQQAIQNAHYPETPQSKDAARKRLAFDELFTMQMYVLSRRKSWRESGTAIALNDDHRLLETLYSKMPYVLTNAQKKALGEILEDMRSDRPMSRLLQGDVGSGKTAVALASMMPAISSGYQAVFMAPTEILAQQHFNYISSLLSQDSTASFQDNWCSLKMPPYHRDISIGILMGSHSNKQKRTIRQMISEKALDIIIGTHSLLQKEVALPDMALAIVDEQHRFGVMQRASLREKGQTPHMLVMSATPIPRSLALTLYGDLDLSVLDELPPGRQKILTKRIPSEDRFTAYEFLRKEVGEGHQCFVVCPLIEESETLQIRAATSEFQYLSQDVFPELSLGLLHGRMNLENKEIVMREFQSGKIDILVSTPVVEVGIDNPNATVILINGADRFGLAQLHQFRGRVGRGTHTSHCLLLSESQSTIANERLEAMQRVSDGFAVAEEDLRFRGPGDFFGTRQSGLPNLHMARLSDRDLLNIAREGASIVMSDDPALEKQENILIATELHKYMSLINTDNS